MHHASQHAFGTVVSGKATAVKLAGMLSDSIQSQQAVCIALMLALTQTGARLTPPNVNIIASMHMHDPTVDAQAPACTPTSLLTHKTL